MDLHTWITQQVDRVDAVARRAGGEPWYWEHGYGDMCNDPTCPYGELATDEVVLMQVHGYDVRKDDWQGATHIALHDPAAVLRRCEADRCILARHTLDPNVSYEPACQGCGTYGDMGLPNTDNLNDCPELLDLAHAHGITDEILAGLDRPQPPEPEPRATTGRTLPEHVAHLFITATPPITTSDVPEALRGTNWKP